MSTSDDQCIALTSDDDRCSRSAEDGQFCHQHDDSDPTVDGASASASDDSSADSGDADDTVGSTAGDLLTVRRTVEQVAVELLDPDLDAIVEIRQNDDGEWHAIFECVERPGIPDTQDILGRYEMTLDAPETVTSYRRVDRYRRSDTDRQETLQ